MSVSGGGRYSFRTLLKMKKEDQAPGLMTQPRGLMIIRPLLMACQMTANCPGTDRAKDTDFRISLGLLVS